MHLVFDLLNIKKDVECERSQHVVHKIEEKVMTLHPTLHLKQTVREEHTQRNYLKIPLLILKICLKLAKMLLENQKLKQS